MPLTDNKFATSADAASLGGIAEIRHQEAGLKTGALQKAIFNSANFSSIATDAKGVIQTFIVGAERMLGYAALAVLKKITPADVSDTQELVAHAKAISAELGTQIEPDFEALVFKTSRGIEDIYELTHTREDGSRFPAIVSVTALRDDQEVIIGYLLIGTVSMARNGAAAARQTSEAKLNELTTTAFDAMIAIDSKHCVTLFNAAAENMFGLKAADMLGASLDRLLPARFRAAHGNHIRQFDGTGFGKRLMGRAGEIVGLHADGHEFPIEASITQLEVNGEKMFTVMLRDITESKNAEETLLKTGALQNAIFNSANFSSIATDAKGVIQIFNVGAERMLGYTALEVMNKITPADISDPQEVIARAKALSLELDTHIEPGFEALVFKASRGIEDIYELTYIRKDGSRFPAIVSVTALRDAQDVIIGYLLIGTDNTARQQADDKLRAASQYARSLIEASLDPLVTISPEGKITDVNAGSVKVTGVARETLIGTDFSNYFTEPDMAREGYQQVFAKGFVTDYPLTIRHENGRLTDVLYNASVYKDPQGKVLGVFAAARDITERKKLDQRLRDQQFYTRSLIESNIDALMTTDPTGIISDVNKQMEALTGCTRDELIGAPFKDYFTDPDRAEAGIRRVLNENKVTNYELTARARDGKETVVSYNATTFHDRERNLQGVFAAARDITERKLLDQILQDNNVELQNAMSAAEKANLAKSDFLSSMSHELRTPLSAILGFAQLIESGTPPPTTVQKRSVEQILQAGWYLLELINEILDLALIESGKLALSPEPVSLPDVMHECEAMIEPQADTRGISVTFPDFAEPCFVNADHTRLKQVFINLLSNAIKYNRPQGKVMVDCVQLSSTRIRISVEDTGHGLTQDKITQLFQPFNRLGQEAHTEQGTGIGLVMTKRLIELMGGTIGVESTVGKGSVFSVEMNLTTQAKFLPDKTEAIAVSNSTPQPDAATHTLLYVEDNPANLMLIENLIERRPDIRLISARDGRSGISLARAALPDLILMDINLPGLSGIHAMQMLRDDPATAHIPVVALSANAMPRDIERGMDAGFYKYLTKPIKIIDFMDTLDEVLRFSERKDETP